MGDRSLPLDEQQLAAALVALDDEPLGGARRGSRTTTASTAIPQPAIAIPVWPVGTKRASSPRARAARSSSSETVIFPIAQSEPTVSTIRAGIVRFAPVGTSRSAGGRRRSRSSTPWCAASSHELRVVREELVQAVLDVQAGGDAALEQLAPGRREAAALGRDADDRGRRPEGERVVHRGDDRDAALRLPRARRVEERDDLPLSVGEHAAGGLPVVRVAGEALGEEQQALRRGRHRAPAVRKGPGRRP